MSVIDKLQRQRKPKVDADLAAVIEQAVTEALAQAHPATPPAAPESRHVRAIMRSMVMPAAVAGSLSGPPPGPAAPMPATRRPLPPDMAAFLASLPPLNIVRDLQGRLSRFSVGNLTVAVTGRDAAGFVTDFEDQWFRSHVERHADGSTTTTTIPTGG